MTLRDKVREVYPENVHDGFSGGVARCPHDYAFLNNQDSRENCNNTNCNECWDREYKPDNNQKEAPNDPIKPTYYNDTNITPFDVVNDWNLDFYLGNAIKYIKRAGKKKDNSRIQDLKKIREYVDQEIQLEEIKRGEL